MSLGAANPIRIETFRGSDVKPYIQDVMNLCNIIYKEPPYYYDGNKEEYRSYVESYSNSEETIISLAFIGTVPMGLAIGTPLSKTKGVYLQTLVEHGYEIDHIFYVGEFGLKRSYRNKGIEELLYATIENFVKASGAYDTICLWEVEGQCPQCNQFNFMDHFWKSKGFIRNPDLRFEIFWTNVGDIEESAHTAVYRIKKL